MTEGSGGREPGGWELLRAVQSINGRLDDFAKGFVSIAVHNLLAEDVKEARAETAAVKAEADRKIEAVRTDAAADVEKARTEAATALSGMRTELDNAKKQRAQTWTAIGLLAAGGAIGLFYDIFTRGLGIGG